MRSPLGLPRTWLIPLGALFAVLALLTTLQSDVFFPKFAAIGDLYPTWYASRAVFRGRNPYSAEVTHEIQNAYKGDPATGHQGGNQNQFVYPAYLLFLIWPLTFLSFGATRAVSEAVLLAGMVWSSLCWMGLLTPQFGRRAKVLAVLLIAGSSPVVIGLRMQQPSVLAFIFISAGFYLACRGRLATAGALFALSTIKPQMAALPLLWIAVWSVGDWRRRRMLPVGFVAGIGVLFFASQWLIPGWLGTFLGSLHAYSSYAISEPMCSLLFGARMGSVLSAAAILILLAAMIRWRKSKAQDVQFLSITAWTLCLTNLCMPAMALPYNEVLVIPVVLLLWRNSSRVGYYGAIGLAILPSAVNIVDEIVRVPSAVLPVVLFATFALPFYVACSDLARRRFGARA